MPKIDRPLKMTGQAIEQLNPQGFEQAIRILAHWLVEEYNSKRASTQRPGPPPDPAAAMNLSQDGEPKLLDIDGLSRYLSMPKSTLYTWVSLHRIPPHAIVRLGRALRFDRKEIDAWIEQQRMSPNQPRR